MKSIILLLTCTLPLPAFGVGTSRWSQTSEADWKNGTFENVVATNLGDLKLSRAVKTLLEQEPKVSSVNALAEAPDGTVYAGTGPHGILLQIKGDAVKQIATLPDATSINCLVFAKDGSLVVGTSGENGKVYRFEKPDEADAKPKELFKSDGVQYIWALQQTPDGNLYVATGPAGQLFEIKPDGSHRILLDSEENNLTALLSDGKDMLYVGTDPNGLVYRVNRKTGESFVLFDAPEAEISALVMDHKGNLYASTAEAREEGLGASSGITGEKGGRPEGGSTGVPIPSAQPKEPQPPKLPDPLPGKPNPIPKAKPDADEEGKSKPESKGSARRWNSSLDHSKAAALARIADGAFFAIVTDLATPIAASDESEDLEPRRLPRKPSPTPSRGARPTTGPAGLGRQPVVESTTAEPKPEGNAVYKIDAEGFVTEVFRQGVLILGMVEREGSLLIATGSEGQVYQVNAAAEETIVLAKVEPKQIMCLLPAKNGRVYMGTANVGSIQVMSSGFARAGIYTSNVLDATQISRFGKMHLHGSLADGTSIVVTTRSGNVRDASEKGWSRWTDEAPATEFLQVSSPSARFLQFRLMFKSEDGKQTPVVQDLSIAYQVPNLPPQIKAVRVSAGPESGVGIGAEAGAGGAPAGPPRRLAITWESTDPNNDPLQYSVFFRQDPETPWILLKDKMTETTFEWDTRSVADGRYEVKVVASDASANVPGDGKTASRVSDPILIDNTPPIIGDVKYDQAGADVKVGFRAIDRSGTIAAADYSVDSSKDWQAILPSDNIWDSPEETASFTIAGIKPGAHQVTLRATDAKGNQAFENVFVTVRGPNAAK